MKPCLYCLLGFLLLGSCEYKIHDNFIDLEEPSDEVDMGIMLNVDNDGETIFLWPGNMLIQYNLVTSGHKPIGCIFRIADYVIEKEGGSGSFSFDSYWLSEGDYTLTCEIYLYTGSGSIAEQTGYESYVGKYEWPVKVVNPNNMERRLTRKINDAGYLELSWDKPPGNLSQFEYYEISTSQGTVIIRDANRLSYIYNTYIGGQDWVQVYAYFKNNQQWFCGSLNLEYVDLNLKVEPDGEKGLLVTWSSPYQTVISVRATDGLLADKLTERAFHIPYAPFGSTPESLSFFIVAAKPEDRVEDVHWGETRYVNRSVGTLISPDGNWASVGYNLILDQLYVSSNREVAGWMLPSLVPTGKETSVPYYVYDYGISLSSDKVVVPQGSGVYILNGKDLSTNRIVTVNNDQIVLGEPVLTSDNKLLLTTTGYPVSCLVYNAETGILESSFDIPMEDWVDNRTFISPNGKYLYYFYSIDQIGVLELENYRVSRRRIIPVQYESWCFNPFKPEQLFVSNGGILTQYDGRNGSVTGRWNVPGVRVGNVDPKTGLLLLYGSNKAVVFDPERGQQIYSLPVAGWTPYRLLGNTLISYNGYALYIGKELQQ